MATSAPTFQLYKAWPEHKVDFSFIILLIFSVNHKVERGNAKPPCLPVLWVKIDFTGINTTQPTFPISAPLLKVNFTAWDIQMSILPRRWRPRVQVTRIVSQGRYDTSTCQHGVTQSQHGLACWVTPWPLHALFRRTKQLCCVKPLRFQ